MGDIDAALDGEIAARQRNTAKAVVGDDRGIARNGKARTGNLGPILRERRSGDKSAASEESCSHEAADGRKHGQFPQLLV